MLPYSQLTVHYANAFHAYSQREYPRFRPYFSDLNVASLEPQVVVEPSWVDYTAGRDLVFETAAAQSSVARGSISHRIRSASPRP